MSEEKKPMNHPDYECWPGGPFNLSKWSRENEPKPPPSYAVGDYVRLTVVTRVEKVYQDCDGTPLYALEIGGAGWSDSNLAPATEAEYGDFE